MQSINFYNIILYLFIIIILLLSAEYTLRNVYGFTDAILFVEDEHLEYIPIPQSRFRFGNNVTYNSWSQRNDEFNLCNTEVLLGFGDSVLNGGVKVDQDSLATTKLSKYLSNKRNNNVVFTNISAASWGPDNCFAYLKKNGDFNANHILLVVSSHDAYDNMNFEKVVGIHKSYPDTQYYLAIIELFDRYLFPSIKNITLKFLRVSRVNLQNDLRINKQIFGSSFNSGFEDFKFYADSTNKSLTIYLHAEKGEMINGKYNSQGEEIIKYCIDNNITLIKSLDFCFSEEAYLDFIHLSENGHHTMYEILKMYY